MSERSRFVVVVSRREPQIFDHLAQALKGTAGVEVLLDRRREQRRKGGAQADDRRRADRRLQPAPRYPGLGTEVVRAGGEGAVDAPHEDDRARAEPPAGEAPQAATAGDEPPAYRTLLWPTVRLADLFRTRPGREM